MHREIGGTLDVGLVRTATLEPMTHILGRFSLSSLLRGTLFMVL